MVFTVSQKVLFRHCDPAGIVFYPRYFEMMNDCVEAFFDRIGHPFEGIHQDGAIPTARIDARFRVPSRHGDVLEIDLECARIGTSSLAIGFCGRAGDQIRFEADAVVVHVGADGRPLPWPDDMRQALKRHMEGRS